MTWFNVEYPNFGNHKKGLLYGIQQEPNLPRPVMLQLSTQALAQQHIRERTAADYMCGQQEVRLACKNYVHLTPWQPQIYS